MIKMLIPPKTMIAGKKDPVVIKFKYFASQKSYIRISLLDKDWRLVQKAKKKNTDQWNWEVDDEMIKKIGYGRLFIKIPSQREGSDFIWQAKLGDRVEKKVFAIHNVKNIKILREYTGLRKEGVPWGYLRENDTAPYLANILQVLRIGVKEENKPMTLKKKGNAQKILKHFRRFTNRLSKEKEWKEFQKGLNYYYKEINTEDVINIAYHKGPLVTYLIIHNITRTYLAKRNITGGDNTKKVEANIPKVFIQFVWPIRESLKDRIFLNKGNIDFDWDMFLILSNDKVNSNVVNFKTFKCHHCR